MNSPYAPSSWRGLRPSFFWIIVAALPVSISSACCLALISIGALAQTIKAPSTTETQQAQSIKPMLRGKVMDPAGAPIVGAGVIVASEGRAAWLSTVSDQSGEFSLALEPGSYTIKINAQGFLEAPRAVTIKSASSEYLDVTLQIATQRDTIVVTDSDTYQASLITSGTKTLTQLRNVPQSITIVTREQIKDQQMLSIGDVVRYTPGITAHQGENNRDQIIFRGNSSSADFFLNGMRDDVQYYRDLYNLDRVEVL